MYREAAYHKRSLTDLGFTVTEERLNYYFLQIHYNVDVDASTVPDMLMIHDLRDLRTYNATAFKWG